MTFVKITDIRVDDKGSTIFVHTMAGGQVRDKIGETEKRAVICIMCNRPVSPCLSRSFQSSVNKVHDIISATRGKCIHRICSSSAYATKFRGELISTRSACVRNMLTAFTTLSRSPRNSVANWSSLMNDGHRKSERNGDHYGTNRYGRRRL
jgi:hypothetical protein